MAILAVILYGNLSPVGWAGNESGGRYVYYDLLVSSFLFCSLELYLPAMMTSLCVNRVIITLFLPLICSGVAFILSISMSEMYSLLVYASGLF